MAAGELADLSRAITITKRARARLADGDPAKAARVADLGMLLAQRALNHGNARADVDEAAEALAAACQLLPAGDGRRRIVVPYLGIILGVRFTMHGGSPGDRAAAIARLREAVADAGLEPELARLARIWLGQLLIVRFVPEGTGPAAGPVPAGFDWSIAAQAGQRLSAGQVQAEAREAIGHLRVLADDGAPDVLAVASVLLGTALLICGVSGMSGADLDRITGCYERALRHIGPAGDGRPEITAVYACLLSEPAGLPGHEAAAPRAMEALRQARDLLGREHPLRPMVLYCLARTAGRTFASRPAEDLVRGAIDASSEALEQMNPDHPLRADTLLLLGSAFLSMAQFNLAQVPVDRLVTILREAEAHPSADPVTRAISLCCYGQALHFQALRDPGHEGLAMAVDKLRQAIAVLPAGQGQCLFFLVTLATMLTDQYSFTGNLEALDAARHYLDQADGQLAQAGGPPYNPASVDRCTVWAVRGHVLIHLAARHESLPLTEAAITDLEAALAAYPPRHPFRPTVASDLGSARLARGALGRSMPDIQAAWRQVVAAAQGMPAGHPDRLSLLGRAGMMCIAQAFITRDVRLFDEGIELLREVAFSGAASLSERSRLLWGLGRALVSRSGVTGNPADLNEGIATLEEACRALAGEPGTPAAALVLAELAEAYHTRASPARHDLRAAVSTGIAALREQVGDVLLQRRTERALAMARRATAEAAEVAGWAVEARLPAAAVEALELGRGLVLYTATALADLPSRLRAAGHGALAQEWEQAARTQGDRGGGMLPWDTEDDLLTGAGPGNPRDPSGGDGAAGPPEPPVPSSLRHRALVALERSASHRALLDPPSVPAIASAIRRTGRDALAYLVPAGEGHGGYAILVAAGGSTALIPLPQLTGKAGRQIDAYAAAQQEAARDGGDDQPRREARFREALGTLCTWAWDAAVGPVLRRIRPWQQGELAGLVLIPCGKLAAVPWHAARTGKPAGRRYALESAVLSYAASARQLTETAGRTFLPVGADAVIVADPVSDSVWPTLEARYIRSAYYPGSLYLGSRAPCLATPARVLEQMPGRDTPGAPMLHLSCHAMAASSPEHSYLRLAGDQPLRVRSILDRAQGRRSDAPGGLVILSACMSDLTTRDYDEALTLATSLLAAGAVGVVGSRWPIGDARTALLMFVFHDYLLKGKSPAAALRSTQLWMLNPDRVIPLRMPEGLAQEVPLHDLADESIWGAFAYQGH